MMILCPLHHTQATKGALPAEEQWAAKAQPFNIREGRAAGQLAVKQPYCAVAVGGVLIVGEGASISIGGEEMLRIGLVDRGGSLAIDARVYDPRDELLAEIAANEWVAGDPLPWDIESDFQVVRLRRRLGEISLEIDARDEPTRVRALLWRHGERIALTPRGVRFGGQRGGGIVNLGLVGMSLDLDPAEKSLWMTPDGRLGQGAFVTGADLAERLARSLEAWRSLVGDVERKTGRNDPCWCGSGLKFKRCHGA
jgi:hypothetical protein